MESEAGLADEASCVYDPTLVLYLANDQAAVLTLDPGFDPLQAARARQTLADLP